MCGLLFIKPLHLFNTSYVLDKGLVLLCPNVCTSPFTASTNFMSLWGIPPLNGHNVSICTSRWRLSLLTQYFLSVFGCKGTICDVHLSKQRCLVDLHTIDLANTRWATLNSCERVFLPINVNAAARDLTMWLLDSIFFIVLCVNFF